MFVYICGDLTCLRCKNRNPNRVQTKLFQVDSLNCMREYHVGDTWIIDGLSDCCPIHPGTSANRCES